MTGTTAAPGHGLSRIDGSVRTYAWGSRTALAELTGRPSPTPHPEAELWFGAHPGAPSAFADGTDLLQVISADPAGQLGDAAPEGRLPFLLKLLAADQALSLQAHPTREQAAEGYARENAEGVPLDATVRNYKDDNHKPELLVALTRFEALAGFRPVGETLRLLTALGVPSLARYIGLLSDGDDVAVSEGLRALVTTWITLPPHDRHDLIDEVVAACGRLAADSSAEEWMAGPAQAAVELSEQHPGDAGILVSLLLNHVVLTPGEAVFLSAGNLHAYLRGTGVEIMANSDNVLRGGLTTKHVDVPELMKVVDFTPNPDPVLLADSEGSFPVPVPEFRLRSVTGGTPVRVEGPAVVLVVGGDADVTADTTVHLASGQAAWVPASARGTVAEGEGHIFVATVNR